MTKEERYLELVSSYAQIPVEVIKSKTRKDPVRETRQMAMYLLRMHTRLSAAKISAYFNRTSHAATLNAIKKTEDQFELYLHFREKWAPLMNKAKSLADLIEREEKDRRRIYSQIINPGDMCWFWNEGSEELPRLGTLASIITDEQIPQRVFTAAEFPGRFDSCVYAGEYVLPKQFLQWRDRSLNIA